MVSFWQFSINKAYKNVPENSSRTTKLFKLSTTQGKMIKTLFDKELLTWKIYWIIKKPRLISLPSYGTATGRPTLPPPDNVSDSPAHLFVGTDNRSETEQQIHPHNENNPISESYIIHKDFCSYFCCGLISISLLAILGCGIYYAIA